MARALEPQQGAVQKSFCKEMGAIYTQRLQALGRGIQWGRAGPGWLSVSQDMQTVGKLFPL